MSNCRCVLLLLVSLLHIGCTSIPEGVKPVSELDLERYQGKWYEIARLDHHFERGLDKVTAEYVLKPNGDIEVINKGYSLSENSWQSAIGTALPIAGGEQGHLKVSFFGPFYSSYVVFYLDDNYQYAFVCGPNKEYLWLLSRTPYVSTELIDLFKERSNKAGFDISELIWVKHS